MKHLELDDRLPEGIQSIVTIGNFDGVHQGHRYIMNEMVKEANKKGLASVVVTFKPHTMTVLQPENPFEFLTTFEEKISLLSEFAIDYLITIPFSDTFRKLSQEQFIKTVLVDSLHAREWYMGRGHNIGKDRGGENNPLHNLLSKYHIVTFTADLTRQNGTIVSSTLIREKIADGNVKDAITMLGHPYLIESERIAGKKIGSQLGYPTLNFHRPPSQKVVPPSGVFAAELEYENEKQSGALYYGDCPTFTGRKNHIEFHALKDVGSFPGIGEKARLWIHEFVRADQTFASKEQLVAQIGNDIVKVKNYFLEEKAHATYQGT
jgi:riboflavin kinase / FMN adenylyltransferase